MGARESGLCSGTLRLVQEPAQAADQVRSFFAQLGEAEAHDFVERRLTVAGQVEVDDTAVLAGALPFEQAALFKAIREFDDGVVLEAKLAGNFLDGGKRVGRKPSHRQEQLVLLGLQAFGACGVLAATQEAREVIPELRELFVLRPRKRSGGGGFGSRRWHRELL